MSSKVYTLSTGATIPAIGLGTWQSTDEEVYNAVLAALEIGYRHIDTATLYRNEEAIGKAIKASGIPRKELFITTKLWSSNHNDPESAIKESLKKLQLDYVDLYLIHWPVALNPHGNDPDIPMREDGLRDILYDWSFTKTWDLLEPLVDKGYTKALGVSNCTVSKLEELFKKDLKYPPVVNQIELHPYLPQPKQLEFAKKHNMILEAYSPLGSSDSPLLKDESILRLAEKYEVSSATILISWALWRGTIVLPKSVNHARIASNFKTVELEDADGELLSSLADVRGGPERFITQPWEPVVIFDSFDH